MPRVSLRSFLATARSTLRSASAVHQAAPVTFVVGNESADLDSICSALVLAYLRTYAPFSAPQQRPSRLYIPLCNLWAPDLALRPELRPVLEQADLKPNDLITLSDVPFPTSTSHSAEPPFHPEDTRWLLVDHNNLQSELGKLYSSKVTGCIDHHDDEGAIPDSQVEEVRIVRPSGSCCSLVTEHCQSAWQQLSSSQPQQQQQLHQDEDPNLWDSQLARVALAPILIDTTNLTSKDKTTPTDVAAVSFLKSIVTSTGDSTFSTDDYFHSVNTAKEAIDDLSLPDILRKDYKQWSESTPKSESGTLGIGISSVVKDIQFLIDKEGSKEKFLNTVQDFAKQRKLSVAGIMTTSHDEEGKFRRELFLWGFDEKGRETAAEFEGEGREKFGLKPWRDEELDLVDVKCWRKCWVQEKVEFSRKKVAPTLRGAVAKI
ncbi:hypothetical protein F5884DRAFT_794407 [Xylogone sp. PMI_703]|nr:hypothetical protein F5884DRAFT_794407 [Xylogone sp. PMI_703]